MAVRQSETVEILHGGQWHPICGHIFWDNNFGADLFCKILGYQFGIIRPESSSEMRQVPLPKGIYNWLLQVTHPNTCLSAISLPCEIQFDSYTLLILPQISINPSDAWFKSLSPDIFFKFPYLCNIKFHEY